MHSKVVHVPFSKQMEPIGIGRASFRLSCVAGDGGAPGQPQVFGDSRHSKVIH